ncbi:aminoacyl-tRNA deacylase [Chengkuizengella axinellae]|uniref:YbaK/EbsC family protein n=1 Tax=Chengkuizengella axinellae TaxID=3064388 RepID=A0ABT9J232_9BACL|nr:YbaK/EbsC family protein [Chengkuizengella sp. 2205SS18-9]MDP5275548.1 YbaK/EbsC family protein [Chengkuizengella sp. 2205SS18-9]
MNQYDIKISDYLKENKINADHLLVKKNCHSVSDAAAAVNEKVDEFVKNVCMVDDTDRLIVAIVKGEDRASTSRVYKVLNLDHRPKLASEEEVFRRTGFPVGGVPSFGFNALFLVDLKVLEKDYIYTGGGSTQSLIKIETGELLKVNSGKVFRIRKK